MEWDEEALEAIRRLKKAIENEGSNAAYHRLVAETHRKQWPTLWAAIDELLELEARWPS